MRTRRRRGVALCLLVLLLAVGASGAANLPTREQLAAAEQSGETLPISSDLTVRTHRGREIELHVRVRKGDDYGTIAQRVAGGGDVAAKAIAAWNGQARIAEGDRVRVPLALLSADYRALVLKSLFPADRREGDDWIHIARSGAVPTWDEGLWQVAEWFTGDGRRFTELMAANRLSSPELRAGQTVRVPGELLHPALRDTMVSDDQDLVFASDANGPFAGYRLKPGEALYSAVILRFTGRTAAPDVGELAETLRDRSGIVDLRDIPVGFLVKIPLELLEPQYLPAGHPRRLEAEAAAAELARELEQRPVTEPLRGLDGMVVVLDPGHGGRDLGTRHNGVWEHDYVYDVTCRLKEKLEQRTTARVVLTLEDRETGCRPSRTDALKANQQGTILTNPPFLARENGEAKVGVNLRWYLANSIYRKSVAGGTDPARIVFLSIHADSRHPSLRGVMVYVPGAAYRSRTYGFSSAPYTAYAEVREKSHVKFSRQERVRSEAVSRKLADAVVEGFRAEGLPIQTYQPVRDRIIRGTQRYVPAVLRGNEIPHKVLVEMVNLSNAEDAALLGAAKERDRMAEALWRSLVDYFGAGMRAEAR